VEAALRRVTTIATDRLLLRPFGLADAPDVHRLCSAREIAESTLSIPHPYPEGAAEEFILRTRARDEADRSLNLAIVQESDGALVGAIALDFEREHGRAEVGYWIGVPYWGRGYATEAAAAVVRHAFEVEGLNRVFAHHFTRNPASGRVLEKIGMRHEGTRRGHTLKWGEYLDSESLAILRSDWDALQASPGANS
jgi:ribosomal-protein-alanine N-acetyltransferase